MKFASKANASGLYIEDTLTDDAFSGVVPFYADPPVAGRELPLETDTEVAERPEKPVSQPAGYIVGVPVPAGLYLPRFDLVKWKRTRIPWPQRKRHTEPPVMNGRHSQKTSAARCRHIPCRSSRRSYGRKV